MSSQLDAVQRWFKTVTVVLLAATVSGCDMLQQLGEQKFDGSDFSVGAKAMVTVAEGGTVAMPGALLVIPAGALDADTEIGVEALFEAPTAQDGYAVRSPVFKFSPSGLVFKTPVEVKLEHLSKSTGATVFWTVEGDETTFEEVPTTLDASFEATAHVTHFSRAYVAAPKDDPADKELEPSESAAGGDEGNTNVDGEENTVGEEGAESEPVIDNGLGEDEQSSAAPSVCSTGFAVQAASANLLLVRGSAPAPVGGRINSGTYVLTSISRFDGGPAGATSNPMPSQITKVLRFDVDGTMKMLDGTQLRAATYAAANATLSLTPLCNMVGGATQTAYTATANTLTMFQGVGVDGSADVFVYSRLF